jgi:two-component system, repressor protein LuxO
VKSHIWITFFRDSVLKSWILLQIAIKQSSSIAFCEIHRYTRRVSKTNILPQTFPGLRVLVVEDLAALAIQYQTLAAKLDVEVITVNSLAWALKKVTQGPWHAALVDLNLPDGSGFELIQAMLSHHPRCSPVVITGEDSLDNAVRASEAGAFDYIEKPVEADRLLLTLRNALHAAQLSTHVATLEAKLPQVFEQFTGQSVAMQTVYRTIETVASSNAPVCITGESGTGKELAALAIHQRSARKNKKLVPINCAAIPAALIESELFGHAKGAFTGAVSERLGAFTEADKGTLFLDEIAELDLSVQAKLLRVLQTGEVKRLGEDRARVVDVRIVCASHRDLREQVRKGLFREDLFYRIYVVPLELPPLRARGDDMQLIAKELLLRHAKEDGKNFTDFSAEALALMQAHAWPGNVRELVNVIRAVVALHNGTRVEADMLPASLQRLIGASDMGPVSSTFSASESSELNAAAQAAGADLLWFKDEPIRSVAVVKEAPELPAARIRPLAEVEREAVDAALRLCGGNVAQAARALQINPSTLYRKIAAWSELSVVHSV